MSEPIRNKYANLPNNLLCSENDENKAKGNDMKPYEKEIKKIAEETKLADQTFVSKVISDELKAANVKIKDDAFKNALAATCKLNLQALLQRKRIKIK